MAWVMRDKEGKIICPNCHRHYYPELGERPVGDTRSIQDIFPHAKRYQREQLITGICSDRCWREYLGCDPDFLGD